MTLALPPIDEVALLAALPPAIAADIRDLHDQGLDYAAIGAILATQGLVGIKALPPTSFWSRLNHELHLLICTADPKYHELRTSVAEQRGITSAALLSMVSSVVSVHLGVEAGLATPFVAMLLLALGQTSTQAWCAQWTPPITTHPPLE